MHSYTSSSTSTTRPKKPGSHEAQQALWTAVALQQHMLRKLDEQGRAPAELRPPRPLPEGQLSLAQKMGLVDRPPDAPDADGWCDLEARSALRGDLARSCAICCGTFSANAKLQRAGRGRGRGRRVEGGNAVLGGDGGAGRSGDDENQQEIAILSCAHTFHANCLRQLEKHARFSRQKRKCPICRQEGYFRRKFETAPAILQNLAVTKIQSVFRGHRARKFFTRLKMKIDPLFRSEYYYKKLKQLTEMRMAEHAAHELEVDQTLDDIDYVMEISSVSRFSEDEDWRDRVLKGATEREFIDCPICLCSIKEEIHERMKPPFAQSLLLGRFVENWEVDLASALSRSATTATVITVREEMEMNKMQKQREEADKKKGNAPLVALKSLSSPSSAVIVGGRRALVGASTRRRTSSSATRSASASTTATTATRRVHQNDAHPGLTASAAPVQTHNDDCDLAGDENYNRQIILTSCQHLYHAACLRSMEKFCCDSTKPRCACCRKGYLKRLLFK